MLRNLPEELQEAIHEIFILRYLLAKTPDHRKSSETVLLYKKEDPLDIHNYRPIALADTLTKLWTGLLADCMSPYAENYDILSSSQEGFRKKKGTARQIMMMLNLLNDARLYGKNFYMLYIDFSSAFNTIDHDKLLMIMYDLGFPVDCIEVIKDLYTNAATEYKLPYGNTPAIQLERGTIQGDSLSPLLFLIFIEPLPRWLHTSGRGYTLQSAAKMDKKLNLSALAYADDLCAVTDRFMDLALQAEKIEELGLATSVSFNFSGTLHHGKGVFGGCLSSVPAAKALDGPESFFPTALSH